MKTALILMTIIMISAITIAWIIAAIIDKQTNYTTMRNKCEEFCTVIGEEFGKIAYSSEYDEYTCMCQHTDTIEYDNATYKLVRLLDYGVIKNVTQ